ncbi:MAG: Crp/Fnr family transcriptional regulator [Dehalococcoidia bacterium]
MVASFTDRIRPAGPGVMPTEINRFRAGRTIANGARPLGLRTFGAKRGQTLYAAGEPAEQLLVLRAGRAHVFLVTEEGKKVVIETVPAPSLLGEAVLGPARLHETYAEAAEDCEVLVVERASVEALLRSQPELAVHLLEAVATRLLTSAQRLEDRLVKAVPARLARALLQLVQPPNYEAFPIKQSEIAEVAGTSRETATRVLNQFESDGIIALGRTRVRLLRPEALSRIAEARAS